jgi:superfamily I DNA/RNA helicase
MVADAHRPLPVDPADPAATSPAEIAAAVLAWAARYRSLEELRAAVEARRADLARLCHPDAKLIFATAHATKGLEFDHVAVIGLDEGRFPSARSLADAPEPDRALEEERRLAYVAWTRARRSLVLVYDPAHPSPFLLEAFGRDELGLRDDDAAA